MFADGDAAQGGARRMVDHHIEQIRGRQAAIRGSDAHGQRPRGAHRYIAAAAERTGGGIKTKPTCGGECSAIRQGGAQIQSGIGIHRHIDIGKGIAIHRIGKSPPHRGKKIWNLLASSQGRRIILVADCQIKGCRTGGIDSRFIMDRQLDLQGSHIGILWCADKSLGNPIKDQPGGQSLAIDQGCLPGQAVSGVAIGKQPFVKHPKIGRALFHRIMAGAAEQIGMIERRRILLFDHKGDDIGNFGPHRIAGLHPEGVGANIITAQGGGTMQSGINVEGVGCAVKL